MDRNSLNVIIFDEEEPSQREVRDSRTTNSHRPAGTSSNSHIQIIEQEMKYLTDKISGLEKLAEKIGKKKTQNSTGSVGQSKQQLDQVVLALEKKIQVVVRQTKKLVDRLGESFEKKIQSKVGSKIQSQGLPQMKEKYEASLKKVEDLYRQEIHRINQRQKDEEVKMLNRVNALEKAFTSKINQFQIKEKQYVNWIHHLERQLQKDPQTKEAQPKSKKMIQVTHAKKEDNNSSILTGDNLNSDHTLQPLKSNSSQINEASKAQRRHRIFDGVGNNLNNSSSVSPNKVVSPLSSQPHSLSSKVINPLSKPEQKQQVAQKQKFSTFEHQLPAQSSRSSTYNNNRETQSSHPGLIIERMTEPLKRKSNNQRQSSPWKVMDTCSVQKSHEEITKRKQIVRDVNASEFYKDVPQAGSGWEGFQNYQENEQSSSDQSQEDVVFYRNNQKQLNEKKWKQERESERWPQNESNWGREESNKWSQSKKQSEEKVFSPFDLS